MADINSQLPVALTDGTLTASIRNTGSNDSLNVAIVDGSGNQVTAFSGGTQYTEDDASAGAESLTLAGAVRRDAAASSSGTDGDYSTINVDANGLLWARIGAALPVGTNSIGEVTANAGTDLNTSLLALESGGNLATIAGATKAEDAASADAHVGIPAMAVQKATPANTAGTDGDYEFLQISAGRLWTSATIDNTASNPIPVAIAGPLTSGSEINDYDTSASVAAAASDNHDYTVANTTMVLKRIKASASGRMKVELKVGPVGTLATKAVWFTSTANPNLDEPLDPPIEVPATSTGTVRLVRTNLEASSMDVYSTIFGNDI